MIVTYERNGLVAFVLRDLFYLVFFFRERFPRLRLLKLDRLTGILYIRKCTVLVGRCSLHILLVGIHHMFWNIMEHLEIFVRLREACDVNFASSHDGYIYR